MGPQRRRRRRNIKKGRRKKPRRRKKTTGTEIAARKKPQRWDLNLLRQILPRAICRLVFLIVGYSSATDRTEDLGPAGQGVGSGRCWSYFHRGGLQGTHQLQSLQPVHEVQSFKTWWWCGLLRIVTYTKSVFGFAASTFVSWCGSKRISVKISFKVAGFVRTIAQNRMKQLQIFLGVLEQIKSKCSRGVDSVRWV